MTTQSPELRSFLTEGILLALSSVAAYAFAFVYEASYADHFGIPYWLIEVGWIDVLLAWVALLSAVFVAAFFAFAIGNILPASAAGHFWNRLSGAFGALLAMGLFGGALMAIPETYWQGLFLS